MGGSREMSEITMGSVTIFKIQKFGICVGFSSRIQLRSNVTRVNGNCCRGPKGSVWNDSDSERRNNYNQKIPTEMF